jgi:predicted HTH domain antitoxin
VNRPAARKLLHTSKNTKAKNMADKDIQTAIEQYSQGKASLAKAAKLAGISIWRMSEELAARKIEAQYGKRELEEDLQKGSMFGADKGKINTRGLRDHHEHGLPALFGKFPNLNVKKIRKEHEKEAEREHFK